MNIEVYNKNDWGQLFQMSLELWTDYEPYDLQNELQKSLASNRHQTFIAKEDDTYVGFAIVSLKLEYVEGATTSPVGYLEGIYVRASYRKNGIAKALYNKGEKWCSHHGCTQMGSDTWEWNKDSINFHKKLGFNEEDVLVHFLKDIDV